MRCGAKSLVRGSGLECGVEESLVRREYKVSEIYVASSIAGVWVRFATSGGIPENRTHLEQKPLLGVFARQLWSTGVTFRSDASSRAEN